MSAAHPHVIRRARLCGRPGCGARIAFALTDAGQRLPVDVEPDPAGNVAVRVDAAGTVRARVLSKERPVVEGAERLHLPHFATCGRDDVATPRADNVVPLYRARARRHRG